MPTTSFQEYLKRLRRVELRARVVSQELMAGQSDSIFKGRGVDFVDVREYSPGDDVRRIDWNVSARLRKPYIKRLVEERELTALLLVDLSASGHFGTSGVTKRELAAEVAGAIAFSALRNNDRVGLILFTSDVEHYLPPRKTRSHIQRLLRDLLVHTPKSPGTSVKNAVEFAMKVTRRPALIFLISDLHDQGYEGSLKTANQRHDLLVLRLVDQREQTLPDVGFATVQDAETGETLEVNTSDPLVRGAYERAAFKRQESVREFLRTARIGHLEIPTGQPWANPLRTFLLQQSRRRVA